uniref:Uncharacterized protein n=1 Tax=Naja naja TaxID=35670 RepID=A0A8C6Y9U8_NAJNA
MEVRLPKPKSERPPPMTWGQVKATTYQAQQQLNQASLPQTPENLVAAVFSIITANSVAIFNSTPTLTTCLHCFKGP